MKWLNNLSTLRYFIEHIILLNTLFFHERFSTIVYMICHEKYTHIRRRL